MFNIALIPTSCIALALLFFLHVHMRPIVYLQALCVAINPLQSVPCGVCSVGPCKIFVRCNKIDMHNQLAYQFVLSKFTSVGWLVSSRFYGSQRKEHNARQISPARWFHELSWPTHLKCSMSWHCLLTAPWHRPQLGNACKALFSSACHLLWACRWSSATNFSIRWCLHFSMVRHFSFHFFLFATDFFAFLVQELKQWLREVLAHEPTLFLWWVDNDWQLFSLI